MSFCFRTANTSDVTSAPGRPRRRPLAWRSGGRPILTILQVRPLLQTAPHVTKNACSPTHLESLGRRAIPDTKILCVRKRLNRQPCRSCTPDGQPTAGRPVQFFLCPRAEFKEPSPGAVDNVSLRLALFIEMKCRCDDT